MKKIEKYILDLIFATRYPESYKLEKLKPLISFGASPWEYQFGYRSQMLRLYAAPRLCDPRRCSRSNF